nr:PlyM14 [uncultured phage]
MTKIIAIDAGHGLNTPGKRTPDNEREWSFNNKVTLAAIKYLNDYEGVKIVRLDDPTGKSDVPLKARTDKANKAKADVLVSIHHNALTGKWGTHGGTEVFTYLGNWPDAERLAKLVLDRILKAYGLKSRGLKKANFHMVRESAMPAILIEGGFMDSTVDIKKMRDDKVLDEAGKAIAEALAVYFGLKKKKPAAPSKLYRVQIGAYSVKANADAQAAKAKRAGYSPYIAREGGLYKVQIGAYSVKANADKMASELKRKGFNVYIA